MIVIFIVNDIHLTTGNQNTRTGPTLTWIHKKYIIRYRLRYIKNKNISFEFSVKTTSTRVMCKQSIV